VAETAGIRAEDRIVAVDGTPVSTWMDLSDTFERTTGPSVTLELERAGGRTTVTVPFQGVDIGTRRDPWDVGLSSVSMDGTVVVDDGASPASRAGLRTGDVLTEIDGQPVRDWNAVRRIASVDRASLALRWSRTGPEGTNTLSGTAVADPAFSPTVDPADGPEYVRWGLASAGTSIGSFSDTSAGKAAGLRLGDRILAIDGEPARTWGDVVRTVSASASGQGESLVARPIAVRVRREGAISTVSVTPATVRDTDELGRYRWRPMLGIGGAGAVIDPILVPRPYPLPEAFLRASDETITVGGFIVEQIGKLFTNEAAVSESLGGPVEMFRQTRAAAERGVFDWARMLGLFSISLGIINLLPVPVLDGGQLVIYGAEWIRGRPLPLVLRERAQQLGVILLVGLMLFVLVNDLRRAVFG
jgi:regulator of sigma E protease